MNAPPKRHDSGSWNRLTSHEAEKRKKAEAERDALKKQAREEFHELIAERDALNLELIKRTTAVGVLREERDALKDAMRKWADDCAVHIKANLALVRQVKIWQSARNQLDNENDALKAELAEQVRRTDIDAERADRAEARVAELERTIIRGRWCPWCKAFVKWSGKHEHPTVRYQEGGGRENAFHDFTGSDASGKRTTCRKCGKSRYADNLPSTCGGRVTIQRGGRGKDDAAANPAAHRHDWDDACNCKRSKE